MLFQLPDIRGNRTRSNAVASGVETAMVPVSVWILLVGELPTARLLRVWMVILPVFIIALILSVST